MGDIIQFNPQYIRKDKSMSESERLKALVQGKIESFTCNTCGEHFDVYNENYPECCPGCGAKIRWNE